jgi:glycosyltransferase involved in cell wall biosynthesis
MPARVLIYTHAFAPKVGGVETVVMSLATGLAGLTSVDRLASLDITVVTPTPRGQFDDESLPFRLVRQPSVAQLAHLIRAADIVHLAGPAFLPLLLGLFFRTPLVIEHHGYQAVCPNGLLLHTPTRTACPGYFMTRQYCQCLCCNAVDRGWLKSMSMLLTTFPRRWMCGLVRRNIAITHHVAMRLQLPRCQIIYHGVEDTLAARRHPLSVPANAVCFAYVGRLVSEKGLTLLVEAARRLKDQGYEFRLKFIGDGPERQRLEDLTAAFGLREEVAFTGFLKTEALQKAVEDAQAVVMPSLWEETAGLAAMEQMMRGRIVIASDIGGLRELVEGVGLKFPVGDVDRLASCMKRVLDEPNLTKVLGQKARQRAHQLFLEERMVAQHRGVYWEAVGCAD